MKPPPGYVKVRAGLSVDNLYVNQIPRDELRRRTAEMAGELLTEALLSERVNTDAPIYVDGAVNRDQTFSHDLTNIKVELHFMERKPAVERRKPVLSKQPREDNYPDEVDRYRVRRALDG